MTDPETGAFHMNKGTTEKTVKVQDQIEDVKKVMNKNVNDAMARGEQLDDLEAKTAALEEGSRSFAKNSKSVSSNLWWANMKMTAIISGVVVAVILVIIMLIFGPSIFAKMFS